MALDSIKLTTVVKMPRMTVDPGDTKKQALKKKTAFVGAFQRAAQGTQRNVGYWLTEAVQEKTWDWPRDTQRQNGAYVTKGMRDIVDTGNLDKSKKLNTSFGKTQSRLTVRYTAPYAGLVHWGGYITPYGNPKARAVYLPPRPWIKGIFMYQGATGGESDEFGYLEEIKEKMLESLG